MDNNDLQSLWQNLHTENQKNIIDTINFEKLKKMEHSKTISKVLMDRKLKILVYSIVLITLIGLMIYALVYLGLYFSIQSLIPFALCSIFFLFQTTSEIIWLSVLSKNADNASVKESLLFFRKKLNRIKTIDFLSNLLFFYLMAIGITYSCYKDINGIKKIFHGNDIIPLLMIIILMLLIIPWLIKYHHIKRYKTLYSNLNKSVHSLED